ncbi:MAG: hypothetical protein J6M02_01500 [Clostridia bacterium]|nr:hypothetical protein [Clostridia bacterium]
MSRVIDDTILCDALFGYEELGDFYEYDIDVEEFRQALNKIEKLTINIKRRDVLTEETLEQLNLLLKYMQNLKELRLNNRAKERADISSIFEQITSNIELMRLEGFDLPNGISHDLANQLEEMRYFSISKCNISQIPLFPKDGCRIVIEEGVTGISDRECIDFCTKREVKNSLYVSGNDEVMKMIRALDGEPLPLALYQKYKDFIHRFGDICISIDDVSRINLEQLEELRCDQHIKNIAIEGGCYSVGDKSNWYSLDEYAAVRREIDNMISQIKMPEQGDLDREKKIFAQVYKLLGKRISYDHYAVDNAEGKLDTELQHNCRNMKNGLLGIDRNGKIEYLSVCAGYADILRNVLACFDIEGEFVRSKSEVQLEIRNGAYEEKKDESGKTIYKNGTTDPMGHAYNLVRLDGRKFYCDLTWDANNIKVDRFPLWNFLNSYEHFMKSHEDVGFDERMADKEANFSLPFEDQQQLFGGIAKEEIMQMMQENYLSGFVSQYLESIKQGGKEVDSKTFLDMMRIIKQVEQAIFNRAENKVANMRVNIGSEPFVFETGDTSKLNNMKKDINRRRMRESGHESR